MPTIDSINSRLVRVLKIAALLISVSSLASGQAVHDVFFVGGQSNATATFSSGIYDSLLASGRYTNLTVVNVRHDGASIYSWAYNGAARDYYQSDFFNAGSSGTLQAQLASIINSNDTVNFEGLFWFQGESDKNPGQSGGWTTAFQDMLTLLRSDLGDSSWRYQLVLPDVNPTYATETEVFNMNTLRGYMINMVNGDTLAGYTDSRGLARTDLYHLTDAARYSLGQTIASDFIAASVPESSAMALLLGSVAFFAILIRRLSAKSRAI